jgi:hypothetical protein
VTAAQLALLLGLFAAPAVLLRLGGRLRRRGPAARGAFWGGVAGHTLGMGVALGAMLLPPVAWTGGPAWREAAVFGSLAAGALLGGALGYAMGARRRGGE